MQLFAGKLTFNLSTYFLFQDLQSLACLLLGIFEKDLKFTGSLKEDSEAFGL